MCVNVIVSLRQFLKRVGTPNTPNGTEYTENYIRHSSRRRSNKKESFFSFGVFGALRCIRCANVFVNPAGETPLEGAMKSAAHRQINRVRSGSSDRNLVPGIRMTCDTDAGIVGQDSLKTNPHLRRTVSDNHLTRME